MSKCQTYQKGQKCWNNKNIYHFKMKKFLKCTKTSSKLKLKKNCLNNDKCPKFGNRQTYQKRPNRKKCPKYFKGHNCTRCQESQICPKCPIVKKKIAHNKLNNKNVNKLKQKKGQNYRSVKIIKQSKQSV